MTVPALSAEHRTREPIQRPVRVRFDREATRAWMHQPRPRGGMTWAQDVADWPLEWSYDAELVEPLLHAAISAGQLTLPPMVEDVYLQGTADEDGATGGYSIVVELYGDCRLCSRHFDHDPDDGEGIEFALNALHGVAVQIGLLCEDFLTAAHRWIGPATTV
jgi:hypothetical protein